MEELEQEILSSLTSENIDHLGLVAGMCQELDIPGIIDRAVGCTAHNKEISFGQVVVCMILNGLGFVGRTLYMYSEYFADKPLGHLLGKEGIEARQIDDNLLGRALDRLFELGVTELFTKIALHAVDTLGIEVDSLHLDSTSFHVDGKYAFVQEDDSRIKLTQGYSRDHRPELNQAVLHLIATNQGNLPLYMQAADGNTSDQGAFPKIIERHIESFRQAVENKYLVADSALYTPASLQALQRQKALFVTRVPAKIRQAKELIQSTKKEKLEDIGEGYRAQETLTEYGGIKQRWILIHSQKAFEREKKTLKKRTLKGGQEECSLLWHLQNREFSCRADAERALRQVQAKLKYIQIIDGTITEHKTYQGRGRPKKNQEPQAILFTIKAVPATCLQQAREREQAKGSFILATNDLDPKLTPGEILTIYKGQQSVERGFRFLKSPDFFVSSLYLKKPERIEALLMVMTLCLLVYAAIEHKTRTQLKKLDLYFLDQKKRPYQKPTTRWIFFCFLGLHLISIAGKKRRVMGLKERNQTILRCLGPPYESMYYAEKWK